MNKTPFVSGLLGTLTFLALLGCAPNTLAARLVDVTVINRQTGERLTPYRHGGRLYVAGTPGDRYAIELKSLRGERVLTVLSVDGVNVLTGETAATLQSGYVIDGAQSYAVNGWRKSMDDVAQFVFTDLPESYAARTGRPGNVGVIGVAVYREKIEPKPAAIAPLSFLRDDAVRQGPMSESMSKEAPAPSAKAESSQLAREESDAAGAQMAESRARPAVESEKKALKLGTGHGEREHSPTRYTEFERSSDTPDQLITIYYDSRASLMARGIIPAPRGAEPKPFPASAGFVADPRG